MLLRPAGSEYLVEPVMLLSIPYAIEQSLVKLPDIHLIINISVSVENFRLLSEGLVGKTEVVSYMRGTALV